MLGGVPAYGLPSRNRLCRVVYRPCIGFGTNGSVLASNYDKTFLRYLKKFEFYESDSRPAFAVTLMDPFLSSFIFL